MDKAIILENTLDVLHQLGIKAVVQKRDPKIGKLRPDVLLRLKRDEAAIDYVAEIKRSITPSTLGAAVAQLRHYADATERLPLLITPYVTPPMTERLKALGQHFVDTAGNAYLDNSNLLVWVSGRKLEKPAKATQQRNEFTSAGIKVLFALICEPALANAPYRNIAVAANVALGAVTPILNSLRAQGHLAVAGRNRRLIGSKGLLDSWAAAYAGVLWPKLLLRTYRSRTFDDWPNWDLKTGQAQWGSEPAAARLVRYLNPGTLTLYADNVPVRLIVAQRLTTAWPHDTTRVVEVRKRFWGNIPLNNTDSTTVPPPLVYADLLATGEGRCIETAGLIYEQYLARFFPQT